MANYTKSVHYIDFNSKDQVKKFLIDMREKRAKIIAWDTQFNGGNQFAVMTSYRNPDKKREGK